MLSSFGKSDKKDISDTGGKNSELLGSVVGMHGQMELHVISILVILDAVLRDDITHRRREEQCRTDVVPS